MSIIRSEMHDQYEETSFILDRGHYCSVRQVIQFNNQISLSYSLFDTGRKSTNRDRSTLGQIIYRLVPSIITVKRLVPEFFHEKKKLVENEERLGRPVMTPDQKNMDKRRDIVKEVN